MRKAKKNGMRKLHSRRRRGRPDPLTIALTVENNWVNGHFDDLVRLYPRKIVAITHRQVAGVGDTGDEAIAQAQTKFPKSVPLLVRVPSAEDLVCVL